MESKIRFEINSEMRGQKTLLYSRSMEIARASRRLPLHRCIDAISIQHVLSLINSIQTSTFASPAIKARASTSARIVFTPRDAFSRKRTVKNRGEVAMRRLSI